jgi:heptosyltransferase-2
MQKICVIQTAFIGDVVLSTAMLESLHAKYPIAKIDIVVRKGNEALFANHPFINEVIVWNKQSQKYKNWFLVLKQLRANKYDALINVQRYAATGLWTALSKAKMTIGFDKNPLSFLFSHKVKHLAMQPGLHEIQKNHALILTIDAAIELVKPRLHPLHTDFEKIKHLQSEPYICIAPASVWFTKQFPIEQWIHFLNQLPFDGKVYIIGGPGDKALGDQIIAGIKSNATLFDNVINVTGQFHFLTSAALQKGAVLNYVNDSAPMHFASAVNAPVVAIYCSTSPDFGYGPLSDNSFIVQTQEKLACKPCGIHGKKACPLSHFNCGFTIQMQQLYAPLVQVKQH